MSHGRGTISLLSRKVKAMKSALDAKHKLPVMNDLFDAEKERDLKKHILPHSARFPILMESLQKCTTKLKPEVLGVSLKIGNGPGSNSARYFFFEHFCALRFNNPSLKYNVDMNADISLLRIHLDQSKAQHTRSIVDIQTGQRMPHEIMEDLCAVWAESGKSATCTQSFEWKFDDDTMQSPMEATRLRIDNAEAQLREHDMKSSGDVRSASPAASPLELSELPLESDDIVQVSSVFKPIDLMDENRPPPTSPREVLRERNRKFRLERKNKKILQRLKAKEEAEDTAV